MKPDSELVDIITAQEKEIVWDKFTTEEAWAVGSTIRELFKSSYKPQAHGAQLGIAVLRSRM
ncbi:hypothetical protein EXIGLDRAFT_758836 [Exidia glandulosa HHB12029]|uniref:Uncharacterized protein n=1 Tax=Exidia glandulosa HHB12029 TaxID=1314781 RepID=A0A165QEC7_EXIGL|nr:hypothetical protein EXIGLDRAFT_758836 [Exidia glandulosa HHB12029]